MLDETNVDATPRTKPVWRGQGGVKRARINRTAKMNIILKHNKTTNHVANSATGEPLGKISHKEKSGC